MKTDIYTLENDWSVIKKSAQHSGNVSISPPAIKTQYLHLLQGEWRRKKQRTSEYIEICILGDIFSIRPPQDTSPSDPERLRESKLWKNLHNMYEIWLYAIWRPVQRRCPRLYIVTKVESRDWEWVLHTLPKRHEYLRVNFIIFLISLV